MQQFKFKHEVVYVFYCSKGFYKIGCITVQLQYSVTSHVSHFPVSNRSRGSLWYWSCFYAETLRKSFCCQEHQSCRNMLRSARQIFWIIAVQNYLINLISSNHFYFVWRKLSMKSHCHGVDMCLLAFSPAGFVSEM